jgi:predicted membrane chloride channel (bestrophin family)
LSFVRFSPRVGRAPDGSRDLVSRIIRWLLVALGGALALSGVLMAPLPGPLGVPFVVLGLILVLRNSFAAKRQFVRLQRARPNMVFPIRRLLRREPEVAPVAWQQYLRAERMVAPKGARIGVKARRRLKRKLKARAD